MFLRFFTMTLILTLGIFIQAQAQEISIIEIRRNIPLADDQPVYKDFYLTGGESAGLKKNMVITAYRKLTIRDSSGAQTYGELQVPVGQLKVISVQGRLAVAREYQLISRDDEPMLEQIGIMAGDRIDLQGSFIDNKKASAKKGS
ncbi:MAG: hypothetical protein LW875_05485 [Proteobacteria bacterium]|jgi:hypothetical protein|nr:hypothetical protein [Pseudomonadota bacterium]